jgi:hypothetical protein
VNGRNGCSVSTAGDVNGDGLNDLIVGAFSASKSYVIFGKVDNIAINLSVIGTGGFVINGENANDAMAFQSPPQVMSTAMAWMI